MEFNLDETEIQPYTFEDHLFQSTREDQQSHLKIYRHKKPLVVLGRGSKHEVELHYDRCIKDEIPVFRRRGGGCSVVLDSGNVIVAVSIPVPGIGENLKHFHKLNSWLIKGLAGIGLNGITQNGISDLVLGEKKVGGTCIYRSRGVLLYSASLLVDPDISLLDRYLKHPPREPEYRKGRPHGHFVTSIRTETGSPSAKKIEESLKTLLLPSL